MASIHRLSLTITGCHSHNYIWWTVINIFYLNCSNQITVPTAYHRGIPVLRVHYWASRHLLGFVDLDLGSSPGWWAATVATYCPSRPGELPKFISSKPCEWRAAQQCTSSWRPTSVLLSNESIFHRVQSHNIQYIHTNVSHWGKVPHFRELYRVTKVLGDTDYVDIKMRVAST